MIDIIIPIFYLLAILLYGMSFSRHIKTSKDFALSHKRYPAWILFATLSASFIGGGFSFGNATQVYLYGIGNIILLWGFSLKEVLVGGFLAPHIRHFKHATSPGEIILQAYGTGPQILTGIFSLLICCGILGAQIGAIGAIFHIFFGCSPILGMLVGMVIIIIYSFLGGMEAVVSIDVIQFFVLAIGLPLTLFFGIRCIGGLDMFYYNIPKTHLNILNHREPVEFIGLFLALMLGECLIPPYLQRLLMGKATNSASKASLMAGLFSFPFFIVTGLIGLCAYILFPNIDAKLALPVMIQQTVPIGLRGFITAATISIVMSTADSVLNSSTIAFSHDILQPILKTFKIQYKDQQILSIMRISTVVTGITALFFSIAIPNIFDLLLISYAFWSPVILMPLITALLGNRSVPSTFYLCVLAGIVGTISFSLTFNTALSTSIFAGVILNAMVILINKGTLKH